MTHASMIYLIAFTSGVIGGDAYNHNRWVGRGIWAIGIAVGLIYSKWEGLA